MDWVDAPGRPNTCQGGRSRAARFLVALALGAVQMLTAPACALLSANRSPDRGSVGAVFAQRHTDGRVFVRAVPRGLPAARGGLEQEDEILLVDGRDVRGMSPEEVHIALAGAPGSTVRLTIWRRGRIERLVLERERLPGQK
jgi:C-terminal processing protease CtpA/Prc